MIAPTECYANFTLSENESVAKLAQSFIDELLDRLDIVEVINRRVKLKKTGKNFTACCPFHEERTPSFSVNPDRQFYYCFGCGAGGNAIGFVIAYERLDFREAVEELGKSVGLEIPSDTIGSRQRAYEESNKPIFEGLNNANKFYQRSLRQDSDRNKVVRYLKSRGLTGEIARDFGIGFAPAGWDNLLRFNASEKKSEDSLIRSGMLIKSEKGRVYDRFRERIMFPILDQRGRVIAFGGRVLGEDKPKYLNSPETPIFQKSRELYGLWQARKQPGTLKRVLVVEGYMDVIALAQHGIPYAVATLGTSTSEVHIERIFRLVPEIIFCFDGDDAGRKAAFRALEVALTSMQDGRQARFLFLPENEDPDTLIRSKGRSYFENLLDRSESLEKFLFRHLTDGIDLGNMDGRARFAKLAAPYLQRLPDGVFKSLMFQELADRAGLDVENLQRLQPISKQSQTGKKTAKHQFPEHSAAYLTSQPDRESVQVGQIDQKNLPPNPSDPVHRLLGILLLNPHFAVKVPKQLPLEQNGPEIKIFSQVLEHIRANPGVTTAGLLGFWFGRPEQPFLNALAAHETLEEHTGLETLVTALINKLMQRPTLEAARQEFEALRLKPYTELTNSEKKDLLNLTQKIRNLSGKQ